MVEDENYGASVQADVRLGNDFGFTSITAYREWDNLQTQDYDATDRFTAVGITTSQVGGIDRGQVNSNQFSQELRLTSPSGNTFDYVVGAYFLKARTVENYQRTISRLETGVVRVYPGVADYAVNSTNAAVFGEGTFTINDKFKTFIGGRLIRDNLSFYHRRSSNAPAGLPGITPNIANEGSTSKSDYSARIGVQYDLTPSINLYSTLARGYKGPAYSISFNMAQAATRALEPETSVSFEAGMKGNFFNRALTLNLAAYSTEFEGFQANYSVEFNGAFSTQLTNAGSVKSEGIEGDFTWRPIENLRIGGAFTFSDARIIRFICPSNTTCPNYDGRTLPFAPKAKVNLDISYVIPLGGDMEIELGADYSWKDDTQYQLTQNPDTIQPAYGIWNASVALAAGDKWELRLVGKNLANQEYSSFIANGNVSGVVRYVPRDIESYYGLIAKARF